MGYEINQQAISLKGGVEMFFGFQILALLSSGQVFVQANSS